MKKLLVTAIGAAAAFGAIAGTISQQAIGTITTTGDKTVGDLNTALGNYWSEPAGATNTYTVSDLSSVGQIDTPISPISGKSLDIKTTFGKPLSVDISEQQNGVSVPTAIPGSGLYFDSLVKFTVCEDEPTQEYSGAKIIMWLQETQDSNGNPTGTNLWVRAGYLTAPGSVVATNYQCGTAIDGAFADAWHRVTIKAMADMTVDGGLGHIAVPGFAIFIDSTRTVICDDPKWAGEFVLTEAADHYTQAGLFPSMVQDNADASKGTLTCASFDGTGSMTDITFTDDAPIAAAEDYVAPKAGVTINGVEQDNIITLADAIGAANGAGADAEVVITLSKNFEFGAPVTIDPASSGVTVVLDFAGFVIENTGSECLITNTAALTVTDSSAGATGGIIGKAIYQAEGATELTIAGGNFWGEIEAGDLAEFTISGGAFSQAGGDLELLGAQVVEGKMISDTAVDGLYPVVDYVPPAPLPTVAENPWYNNPKAVVLAENLPQQTGNYVSAFHGQGAGEYLGLTYSTNPMQFDLFKVDGLNPLTTVASISSGDAALNMPGFRGVAISETLGVAMTLAYYAASNMYTFPLTPVVGGYGQKVVTKLSTHAFDSAAFSPDGKYLFSNAIAGEGSDSPAVLKWSVSVEDGAVALTKIGRIDATGRHRNLAYARINKRDLVFALAESGKVDVIDMTGDDTTAWTSATLLSGLPKISYGSLCVSGVNVVDGSGNPATPHLTVATSANGAGNNAADVLNVYALTVPASGAVTASLVKSFNQAALTAAGFGDISDASRYGNTVYVTDDEATIYFGRPDAKLYAAQFAYKVDFVVDGATTSVSVFPGDTVTQADPTKENYIFDGWFLPGAGQAFDLSTPVTQDLTLTAQFTPAKAKVGSALYLTFKEAVEAAPAGATVEVLDDCTEPGMVTITAGITISNNYTVALTGMYALRFANGSTPVTICGTGTLAGSGEGSPLLIGSNETTKNAKYEITTTYEGSVILDGNTITYSGSGNVIKVEYGTFTMNSGTVTAGGNRGVKADADVGNFTSTVIINGGAITSTKAAVAASADTGTAVATINGGDITGPLSCGQKAGTATLTIPGTSTAKFSAQPDAAYVESGYETVLSDGWYVVQAVAPSGLDPAADVTNVVVTAASPEAAIQTVDVTPPTGSGATAGDYKSLFTYEATPAGEGQYTVAITGIQEAVKEDVSEDAVTSLVTAAEDSTATTVTVDVPAGLYYKVTTYDTIGGTPVDTKTGISYGSGTTPVNKPTSATQGFIKVEIGTKAFN